MPSSVRFVPLAVLLLAGACAHPKQSPEEGWPQTLDFSRLPRPPGAGQPSMVDLFQLQQSPDVRTYSRTYHQRGPFHGTSHYVTITWLPDRGVFYLSEDCMMGHFDEPVGPFDGDPRTVLAPAAP